MSSGDDVFRHRAFAGYWTADAVSQLGTYVTTIAHQVLVVGLGPGTPTPIVLALLAAGQLVYGLALGCENANEMGYRQAVTPDPLQGRMNTTMRSVNRAMIVVGAPLGGLMADHLGYLPTLVTGIVGFVRVGVALACSPFRHARHNEHQTRQARG